MNDASTPSSVTPWWGPFDVAQQRTGRWTIGPATIWLHHTVNEWRVMVRYDLEAEALSIHVPLPADKEVPDPEHHDPHIETTRFSDQRAAPTVQVRPALADQSVVLRPETPLYLLPEQETTLFLSTPLWACFEVGTPALKLNEVPLYPMRKTWFGPTTMEGEVCYAVRTLARLQLADQALRWHRALTPVRVRNKGEEALLVSRLKLPVQHLALYASSTGYLWTQQVMMEPSKEGDLAMLRIEPGPPSPLKASGKRIDPVAEPRVPPPETTLIRRFSSLFNT